MLEDLANVFYEYQEKMAKAMENIRLSLERFEKNLKPMEEKFVQAGWTINMNMPPSFVNEVSEVLEVCDIDSYMYEYIMYNDKELFKMMHSDCKSKLKHNLLNAYEECLFAFDNQKYIICANTLLTIIEGTLSTLDEDGCSIYMISLCKKQLNQLSEDHTIKRTVWYLNLKFIENLYSKHIFSSTEPSFINRHWLLHGRSNFEISEIDCVRLFNAISTICSMI